GQYQGSQAFSHVVPGEAESINPNTGSLNFKKILLNLRGKRESIDLSLGLSYSFGSFGVFGLPVGWTFNIPYVIPGGSVTIQERTYAIDLDWSDSTGYKSGLRYINNHGISFTPVIPPQPLPSGSPGEYSYKLQNGDGSVDYFDAIGRPLAHDDLFGNSILYNYVAAPTSDIRTAMLDSIEDSWGQRITFGYQQGSQITLTAPDGGSISIGFDQTGVRTITDPAGLETQLSYVNFDQSNTPLLIKIQGSSGIVSQFNYIDIQYLDLNGNPANLPAVQDFYHSDLSGNILQHKNYSYGTQSGGQTFTGVSIGCRFGSSQDGLMDGAGQGVNYQYDVIDSTMDENGKEVSRTSTWFNYLHLPVSAEQLTKTDTADFLGGYRMDFQYDISSDQHARSTNFSRPTVASKSHSVGSGSSTSYEPMSQVQSIYNEFGNTLSVEEDIHQPGVGFVPLKKTTSIFITTPDNIQLPLQHVVVDLVAGSENHTTNTLTSDQKSIGSSLVSFVDPADPNRQIQPQKIMNFEYDTSGNIVSNTIGWAPGASVPQGSVSQATTKTSYNYQGGILSVTTTDPLNGTKIIKYDMRVSTGPLVHIQQPLGQSETYEYDILGRLLAHTNQLGDRTEYEYAVGTTNSVKSTDQLGYATLITYDPLGREIKVMDNGDPTQAGSQLARVISQTKYNTQSLVVSKINILGLVTTYEYDSLSRPVGTTDPLGNVMSYEYNDENLTVTEKQNGEKRAVSQMDGISRIISRSKFPDPEDVSTKWSLTEQYTFDGNNRKIKQATSSTPLEGSGSATVLKSVVAQYGMGPEVISQTETASSDAGGQDNVKRTYTLDLFGNVYTWEKVTTYGDGRAFTTNGPVNYYDACSRFVRLQNQLGQSEVYQYNQNGWLASKSRFDGTQTNFEYDNAGQMTKATTLTEITEVAYVCLGRKSSIMQDGKVMKYGYSLDGTLTATVYEDGLKQVCSLDNASRVVTETDVGGVVRKTSFTQLGQVASRSCQSDTLQYVYGTANHTIGQLIGTQLAGSNTYFRRFTYDGFGNIAEDVYISVADSRTLMTTTYQRDPRQRIQSWESASDSNPSLNEKHEYQYDGVGQLLQDASGTSQTTYTYDGNFNVASVTSPAGETTSVIATMTRTMTYNVLDQRTDSGFKYDTNGRMLADDQGRTFSWNNTDKLLSVQVSAGVADNGFNYHPDGLLAQRQLKDSTSTFYYNKATVNVVDVSDSAGQNEKTSLFSGVDRFIAGYSASAAPTYFFDQQGSVSLIEEGSQQTTMAYQAYGAKTSSSPLSPSASFGFRSEYVDQASGLVYLRSRYYNPTQMAFISMDSALVENRYAYCVGDPVNMVDPSGHVPVWGAVLGLMAALAAAGVGIIVAAPLMSATLTGLLASSVGAAAGNALVTAAFVPNATG
ncbi:uncharacterized protein BDZ83DRAFT_538424, partial [Colletotrichum acutatum]